MSQSDLEMLASLILRGFKSVGCIIPVTVDESSISIRDIFVEVGTSIECFKASSPEAAFLTFPAEAAQSAAATICMTVIAGIVSRAIEQE